MTRRMWSMFGLVLVLAAPGVAGAGEVHLTFKDGRVALVARDATLREILLEWERVGGTRIVNRDRTPATRLSLEMVDVPEAQALATLLRSTAGYMASRRVGAEGGASGFSRLVLMPGEATPLVYPTQPQAQATSQPGPSVQPGGAGPPFGRAGMQRRVLPDGRVVTVMTDDAQRADQADDPDDDPTPNAPGMMRPPFNAPQRVMQGQGAGETPQPEVQPGQAQPPTSVTPSAPPTVATPGTLPVQKVPPTPPKPPGH